MPHQQTVADLDLNFEDLLYEAESNAKGAWEEEFVDSMIARYDEYAERMFISDRQLEILERIAEGK